MCTVYRLVMGALEARCTFSQLFFFGFDHAGDNEK